MSNNCFKNRSKLCPKSINRSEFRIFFFQSFNSDSQFLMLPYNQHIRIFAQLIQIFNKHTINLCMSSQQLCFVRLQFYHYSVRDSWYVADAATRTQKRRSCSAMETRRLIGRKIYHCRRFASGTTQAWSSDVFLYQHWVKNRRRGTLRLHSVKLYRRQTACFEASKIEPKSKCVIKFNRLFFFYFYFFGFVFWFFVVVLFFCYLWTVVFNESPTSHNYCSRGCTAQLPND